MPARQAAANVPFTVFANAGVGERMDVSARFGGNGPSVQINHPDGGLVVERPAHTRPVCDVQKPSRTIAVNSLRVEVLQEGGGVGLGAARP